MDDGGLGGLPATEPRAPLATSEPVLDPARVRSFIGLVIGRLGPRAFGAVAGIFLALLVAEHTNSLLLVTFALTAHRIVTWIAFPFAGRISDRSHMALGRRVPFMAGGLIVAGICTALYTHAASFWQLVVLLMITRVAMVAYTVPAAAVTPEAFGRSRWLRAGVAVTVLGGVVGLSIRITAIATWKQNDPSTWAASYYLSAAYIVFAGLAIALLVREVPAAEKLRKDHPTERFRTTVSSMLSAPNAKPLLAGVLLAIAAGGAFNRAYPIYARDVLGAGGGDLAAAGIWGTALTVVSIPLAVILSARVSRKTTGVLAALAGGGSAIGHLWATELWHSVVLLAISSFFLSSAVISLAPLYLQILPRRGGLGERIGVMFSPVLLAGMFAAFLSGFVYDVLVEDYRIIWIPTALFAFACAPAYLMVRLPPHAKRADPRAGWHTLRRILWGKREERRLFSGNIDEHEADGALLFEIVADELNPYMDRA